MRLPGFIKVPFATTGDRTTVPDAVQSDGSISMSQGWGPDYQRDMATDPLAKPVGRQQMNYLLNIATVLLGRWQSEVFPEWIDTAANGGTAFAYSAGAVVNYSSTGTAPFVAWVSTVDNNTSTPGTATWARLSDIANILRNPTATLRGAPLKATLAQMQAASDDTTMVTPAMLAAMGGKLLNVRRFGSAYTGTTYTPTAGTRSVIVCVQAAGGAGGSAAATVSGTVALACGGGAGDCITAYITAGFSGVLMTIPPAVAGQTTASAAGGGDNGGACSFGTLVTAAGGKGGFRGNSVPFTGSRLVVSGIGGLNASTTGTAISVQLNAAHNYGFAIGDTGQAVGAPGQNSASGSGGQGLGIGTSLVGIDALMAGGGGGACGNANGDAARRGGNSGGGSITVWEYA